MKIFFGISFCLNLFAPTATHLNLRNRPLAPGVPPDETLDNTRKSGGNLHAVVPREGFGGIAGVICGTLNFTEPMKRALWIRIALYAVAMTAVMAAVGTASYRTWWKIEYWQDQFGALQRQSLAAANEWRMPFRDVNLQLVRFLLWRGPAERALFLERRTAMSAWFTARFDETTAPEVRQGLFEMQQAYADFVAATDELLPQVLPERVLNPDDLSFRKVDAVSRRLMELDSNFAQIQTAGRRSLFSRTRADLEWLENALFVAMILIAALTIWSGRGVYRKFITPLQLKLVETQAIVERQEKLSALGTMAAGLAHEIRNPLTAIKVRLFTQRRQLGDAPSAQEDNLFIGEELSRLEKIVQEFLQFARPAEPELQVIHAAAPVKDVRELLGPELVKSGIELRQDTPFDPEIRADRGQLRQVLINLVRNAAESIGENGVITMRTGPARGQRKDGTRLGLVLEVEDTGKGIPPEVQQRLFDPFFTTRAAGTGLGLSIVARVVEAHGGVVEYQSHPRQGTLFRLLLPLAQHS